MVRPLVLILVLTLSATGAWADRWSDCNQSVDPNRRIRVCTSVIERGASYSKEDRAHAYNKRGLAYVRKRNYDRAIADFGKAIALNPEKAGLYSNRGNAHRKMGEVDRAIQDYGRAIALNAKFALAYNNRGNAYRQKGEVDRAIRDYDKAIALNPKYVKAYNNRGNAYRQKGEFDRAIANYTKGITLNPKFALAYDNRGLAYARKGEVDRADADYAKAKKLKLKHAGTFTNRGLASRGGDPGPAKPFVREGLLEDALTRKFLAFAIGGGIAFALLALLFQQAASKLALDSPRRVSQRFRYIWVVLGIGSLVAGCVDFMWPNERSAFDAYTWVIELVIAALLLRMALFQNENMVARLRKGMNWKVRAYTALTVGTASAMGLLFGFR